MIENIVLKDNLVAGYVVKPIADGDPSVGTVQINRCGTGDDIKILLIIKAIAIVLQPIGNSLLTNTLLLTHSLTHSLQEKELTRMY